MLFPEVVWCDVMFHSNNKGFCLLTYSCCSSVDKQVAFLWIWIPNQQHFCFWWNFQHAFPTLIPLNIPKWVKFIMKDGDAQQWKEVMKALKEVFPSAVEGACGWHLGRKLIHLFISIMSYLFLSDKSLIPTFSYSRLEGPCVPCSNVFMTCRNEKWNKVVINIRKWCYTWMHQGYVHDEEDYKISKYLLLEYIQSNTVLFASSYNQYLINSILKFLQYHVFVCKDLYLNYLRKHVNISWYHIHLHMR